MIVAAHLLLPVIQPSAEENEVSMRMKDLVKLRNLGDVYVSASRHFCISILMSPRLTGSALSNQP